MKEKIYSIGKTVLICLMAITVLFILYQSSLPPEESKETSDSVGGIIADIIPPETPPGQFIQINLRKIAHFVEFAVLGAEFAAFVLIYFRKWSAILFGYPAAIITALLDETLQVFTGRGPDVKDVWLDFSGFLSSSLVIFGVFFLLILVIRLSKKKNSGSGENGENFENNTDAC